MTLPIRIGSFDLECSNLNADFGILLCGAVKEMGVDTPHVFRIDKSPGYKKQPWNDAWLAQQLRDLLSGFDMLFGWNSSRFDWPFLNTRLVKHGIPALPKKLHKDALYTSRYKLRLHSNRLASVQEFFDTPTSKSSIDGNLWTKALTGDRESMDYIVDHCERDVVVLEQIIAKLVPLMSEINNG